MNGLAPTWTNSTYLLRLRQATIGTSTARIIMAASRPDKPATMVIMACGSPSEVTLVTVREVERVLDWEGGVKVNCSSFACTPKA